MRNIQETYQKNGWVGPLPVFSRDEISHYHELALDLEERLDFMKSDYRCKSNVLFSWVDEMSRHPALISYVEQLIGPNFHCWDVLFWIKRPGDGKKVSFHQDATYWNFNNKEKAVSAWIAFNDVTEEQGPVEYVDGSHVLQQKEHLDIKCGTNLLMRGQTVDSAIAKTSSSAIEAGSVLLHHPYVIHGSQPNRSVKPRVACGMIFASTECEPVMKNKPESTVMIHGQDHFGHMRHDSRPGSDWEKNLKNWKQAYDDQHENYYALSEMNSRRS